MQSSHRNHLGFVCVALWLSLGFPSPLCAQKAWECRWTSQSITIDGEANEEVWARAELIDSFVIPGTKTHAKATTRVRWLWDREYLYFCAQLDDADLFADVVEHDGITWNNDVFEAFFWPSTQSDGYFEFQVNAAGTMMDLFLPDTKSGGYNQWKSSHHFGWKTFVKRTGTLNQRDDVDQGWTIEGRIPWTDFLTCGGRPQVDESWRVTFCRYDYTAGKPTELSSATPLLKANFHSRQEYREFRFVGPGESDPTFQALLKRPNRIATKISGSPEPPLPFQAERAYPELKLEWPIDSKVIPTSGELLIIQEQGAYGPTTIHQTRNNRNELVDTPLIDPNGVAYHITFHPDFASNGYMYLGSNAKVDGVHKSRVVRYELTRTAPHQLVGDPLTIIEWDSNGHNGAATTFGSDGMLYVTSGDGTSDSDANNAGQDRSHLLSKVLRIDVSHSSTDQPYTIPRDNPWPNTQGIRPETWAYGLRNPWRICTDAKSGRIWIGNNGQDLVEQVYLLRKQANYGWSVFEGSLPFYPHRALGPEPHELPIAEHPHSESRSLTGGVVYHGNALPELDGVYLYADYSTGKIWGLHHDGTQVVWNRELADTSLQITSISLDIDGELLISDHRGDRKGGFYRLVRTPKTTSSNTFPKLLSQTGLFQSIPKHQLAEGVVPYDVNSPLWSDGAVKVRAIALPPGGTIEWQEQWAWNFPDNTTILKSFALPPTDANQSLHHWIETRLLVKQQGEWVGYSYAWRDDQSDAELVEAKGRDQTFPLGAKESSSSFAWHYPSRTECMVCHTRAANFVLGLSTLQMNRTFDYGNGVMTNQLEALEAMGLFKSQWLDHAKAILRKSVESSVTDREDRERLIQASLPQPHQRQANSSSLLLKPSSHYMRLVDPYDDDSLDWNKRARSYLHANCAYCHVEAGGGNAQVDFTFWIPQERMKAVDVRPIHHTFGQPNARIIAPGSPQSSVLLHRLGMRGAGQMPQLGTKIVDDRAVELFRKWIETLPTTSPP